MGRAIQFKTGQEGEIFIKWLERRLIRNNKNVLGAELGATGSGKSYRDLRKAELWYQYHFKEPFPTKNICFGVAQVMELLAGGKLRRGKVIIMEEGGLNLGSRDWKTKFSKMFNYVLQSFRSMNLALFMNLPYLSMLDSQARHLLHYYAESAGIDFETGINKCKPFFIQVAQSSGKIYRHYPKVKVDGRFVKVKRFGYAKPSQYIIDAYEAKKAEYLRGLIKEYSEKTNGLPKIEVPTNREIQAYVVYQTNRNYRKVAEMLGRDRGAVTRWIKKVENYLKTTKKGGFTKEIGDFEVLTPLLPTTNLTS